MKTKFGLTPEEYLIILDSQQGLCASCGRAETAQRNGKVKRLAVDHNHETGTVRALLCQACNTIIGIADEDIEKLSMVIKYLEKFPSQIA